MQKIAMSLGAGALAAATLSMPAQATPPSAACWGQVTAVFAQMVEVGEHSASRPTPRAGLRHLARLLAVAGEIPDD